MDIKYYVRALRDEFFKGEGSTIYLLDADALRDFAKEAPYELYNFGVPNIREIVFPLAIIYNEANAFWVDSSGALWSCGQGYCRFIKSKDWLPS